MDRPACGLSDGDVQAVNFMYPLSIPITLQPGLYTIQQQSNGRVVDAYQSSGDDFALVTRTAKNNDAQRWTVTPSGNNMFTVQQKSTGRFADAHEIEGKDFALVTRSAQNNDTQRWLIKSL